MKNKQFYYIAFSVDTSDGNYSFSITDLTVRLLVKIYYWGSPTYTKITNVVPLRLWSIYAHVGDFCVNRGPPTVPKFRVTRFFWSPKNPRNAGTLCNLYLIPLPPILITSVLWPNTLAFGSSLIITMPFYRISWL